MQWLFLAELTSNWCNFNRYGQIDGLDDMDCNIASKLSKIKKVRDTPFTYNEIFHIFHFYGTAQWVVTKFLKPQVTGSNSGIGYYVIPKNIPKYNFSRHQNQLPTTSLLSRHILECKTACQ